ncbi:MAG: hypothetical protein GWO10_19280 [candidate division Zixibacteria bacterium]|nr:hypothetical protein [candidate division Zixibacteria bacterium]NIX00324.1 hypothetical protein [Phycisphaerae bacterium]
MANTPGYPGVIAIREDSNETPTDAKGESGIQFVGLMVWDPDALDWTRMRQPLISPLADDLPLDTRFESDSNKNMKYKGIHATHKALTSDSNWLIWKFTWELISGDYCLKRIEGPLEGAWDNRASLAWA